MRAGRISFDLVATPQNFEAGFVPLLLNAHTQAQRTERRLVWLALGAFVVASDGTLVVG
ncbi:MAG: hypothetical protein JOZ87_16305 [Chloroflexi bacterium]|nr:hypothetical protein [Chloroflexota bacterium]